MREGRWTRAEIVGNGSESHLLRGKPKQMTKTYYQILKNRKVSISLVVIAVAALAVLLGFARSSKPAQAAPQALEVGVVQVEQKNVPIYSEWIGTTEGMVNAELKAQVTGYLLRQDSRKARL